MRRYTLQELVEYAFYNRRGKAFLGWTIQNIYDAFMDSLRDGTLVYSVDGQGTINGVIHATRFETDKVLFVGNVLTTGQGVMKEFVRQFQTRFPEYRLEADRRFKRKIYNTTRLVQLFTY